MSLPPSPSIAAPVRLRARLRPLITRQRRGVVLSLGARALEAGAKFGLYALAARALGGHDAGRFFLALSVIQIVSTVARLGLDRPMTRHVAAELAVGDTRAAWRAAVTGCGAVAGSSCLVAFVLALGAPWIAERVLNQADMVSVLVLAAVIIPVQNLAFAMASVLVGLERSVAAQMVMNALAPALSLAALILWADEVHRLLSVYAAAFGVCALLGLVVMLAEVRRRSGVVALVKPAAALPSLWQGARPLWISEVAQAALLSVPVLVLGAFADPQAVSVFSICSRLSMLVTTVVLSLGALSAPVFARHHRLGDWSALRDAVTTNRKTTILLCVPLTAGLAIGAGPMLELLGIPVAAGAPVLLILLVGQLAYCLLPSRDLVLAMAGHGRALRGLSLWQLAGCVALCLVLIPPFGAVGAALSSATIWIGGATALAMIARRRLPQLTL
ncbi:MAG: oligosaccharide flippase family protein [Pseudomonadota bacterium]